MLVNTKNVQYVAKAIHEVRAKSEKSPKISLSDSGYVTGVEL